MLSGKVALVAGGAQGLGRAIAETLADHGAWVFVADIQDERGLAVAELIRRRGGRATAIQADLRSDAALTELFLRIDSEANRLDVLVNSVALARVERLGFPANLSTWDTEMDALLKVPVFTTAKALPLLRKSRGVVINMSSVLATVVAQESAAYHAAKAALVQFTRYLASHEATHGVRANAVLPAIVDREHGPKLTDDRDNRLVATATVPLGRAASGKEIGAVVAFLSSDAAAYVNGQAITVDGGLELGENFHVGRQVLRAIRSSDGIS